MRIITAADLKAALPYHALVERLRQAFRDGAEVPMRHHHSIPTAGADGTLLLMPAWRANQAVGVKVVTVFPDNGAKDLPAVQGVYLLLDGDTGVPQAFHHLDGEIPLRHGCTGGSGGGSASLTQNSSQLRP